MHPTPWDRVLTWLRFGSLPSDMVERTNRIADVVAPVAPALYRLTERIKWNEPTLSEEEVLARVVRHLNAWSP